MKRILPGLFLSAVLCWLTLGAEPSPEAVRCFEWFKTMGYPDLTHAPLAEVWTAHYWWEAENKPGFSTEMGFVTKNDPKKFSAIFCNLASGVYTKTGSGTPEHERVGYEERNFPEFAVNVLKRVRDPQMQRFEEQKVNGHRRYETELYSKRDVFFLAFVCWQKGENELAGDLFKEAQKLPFMLPGIEPPTAEKGDDVRVPVEMELAYEATWKAYLMMSGDMREERTPVPTRKEVLAYLKEILRKYQFNPLRSNAQKMADVLERMVKEDAAHVPMTDEALAKLPVQKRVKELIYRLRDASGMEDGLVFGEKSTAKQLFKMGYDAVPQLIEALEDDRLSRSVGCHRPGYFSHFVLTVGDCAERILESISRQQFRSPKSTFSVMSTEGKAAETKAAALEWWQKAQADGEKETLVKVVSSGRLADGVAERLKLKYPEALEEALLTGAAKVNVRDRKEPDEGVWMENGYIERLGELKTKAANDFLVCQLTESPWVITQVGAAEELWKQRHPAAIPAMIQKWKEAHENPTSPAAHEAGRLIHFMVGTGQNDAATALISTADDLSHDQKCALVQHLGEYYEANRDHPGTWTPAEPATLKTEEAFLVHELEDISLAYGMKFMGRDEEYRFESARLCDFSLWSLHQLAPQCYACSKVANGEERDRERLQAANAWRKEHHERLLVMADLHSPSLATAQSLRIASVVVASGRPENPPVFLRKILELKGQTFAPDTLVRAIEDYQSDKNSGIASLMIQTVRGNDLSGVRMLVTVVPGVTPENIPWRTTEFLFVDEKPLPPIWKFRENPEPPKDDDWHFLTSAASKAIDSPPTTPFTFNLMSCKNYR